MERLFQIGWNNLHSKSDSGWTTFLPKLLKAVHLPLVSDGFLSDIARKVEDCEEAKVLIEEAKHEKQAIANHNSTSKKPKIKSNIRWRMSRFQKSGPLSVTCHGLNEDLNIDWHGAPVFINGKAWCLYVTKATSKEDGPPVKSLGAYMCRLSGKDSKLVKLKYKFELASPSKTIPYSSCKVIKTFDKDTHYWGLRELMKLSKVLEEYYDKENDSCTVIAHVSEVDD